MWLTVILSVLSLIFAFLICIIVTLLIYTTWNYGSLDGLGFPVIKPYLIFGSNYMDPYTVQTELTIERLEKYGTIYGAYDGRTPVIYISDPKLSRLIRTVDSDYFRNHAFDMGNDPIMKELLDILDDDKWKTVRAALTPMFTTGKIKQMSRIMKELGDSYAMDLAKESINGKIEKFDMKEYSAPLVIECLARSFCGIEIPNARDPNNEFIKQTRAALFDGMGPQSWLNNAFKMFPFLLNFFPVMTIGEFFTNVVKQALESRLKSNVEGNDATNVFAEMLRKVRENDKEYKSLGINETTVIAQVCEFFLASYMGISEKLVGLSYELSKNPEIQEKVYEECSNLDDEYGETPYTLACVNEILRLYISSDKPERKCNRTWTHEGITIPKGTQVVFPISALHYNPKYFPEPMKFKPERFLDKSSNASSLLMVFGQGPRACIGSRFGTEIIRVLLISFIKKFQIVERSDTAYVKSCGGVFTIPAKPVNVDLILR